MRAVSSTKQKYCEWTLFAAAVALAAMLAAPRHPPTTTLTLSSSSVSTGSVLEAHFGQAFDRHSGESGVEFHGKAPAPSLLGSAQRSP